VERDVKKIMNERVMGWKEMGVIYFELLRRLEKLKKNLENP
jgi:hypothetical protein